MSFIHSKAVRTLVAKRLALLKELAPTLRKRNPYAKDRVPTDRQRRHSAKAIRAAIDATEIALVVQVTKEIRDYDAQWPKELRNSRRRQVRWKRRASDPGEEEFVTQADVKEDVARRNAILETGKPPKKSKKRKRVSTLASDALRNGEIL